MQLFHSNVHCKHVVLAASGDNSYAGFLRQYSPMDRASSRVVLIESIPFASKLEELAAKFPTTRLPGLFRDSKIDRRRVSFHDEKIDPQEETSPLTYASTVKQTNGMHDKQTLAIARPHSTEITQAKSGTKIFQNSKGQRVDQDVNADRMLVNKLKSLKLCNRHFLTHCHFPACTHRHEGKLDPKEINALKFIARLSPCRVFQSFCEDPDCVAGHRCMQGADCQKGQDCWFSEDMHNIDTTVVRFIIK